MQIMIDIPENELTCMTCPCREPEDNLCMLGYAIYKDYKHIDCVYDGRPDNCPCVVLSKHDRLVDVSDLYAHVHGGYYDGLGFTKEYVYCSDITSAPTIVPANTESEMKV